MSEPAKTLLVDIGNTRIKYAHLQPDLEQMTAYSCATLMELEDALACTEQVIFCSVRGDDYHQPLIGYCAQQQIDYTHVTTQAESFGIHCAYQRVENLGVDRWLAVLAARLHTPNAVAVIDLGTAATCDIVVDNQHLGGWIAPGFQLMRTAVTTNTSRVFADDAYPLSLQLGEDTADCVSYGCLAMLQGFIHSAQKQLQLVSNDYRIILCGGDLGQVELDDARVIIKQDLVLHGLSRFAVSQQ